MQHEFFKLILFACLKGYIVSQQSKTIKKPEISKIASIT